MSYEAYEALETSSKTTKCIASDFLWKYKIENKFTTEKKIKNITPNLKIKNRTRILWGVRNFL